MGAIKYKITILRTHILLNIIIIGGIDFPEPLRDEDNISKIT